MAWSKLVRRTILRCFTIRAQNLTLNGPASSFRSLSSNSSTISSDSSTISSDSSIINYVPDEKLSEIVHLTTHFVQHVVNCEKYTGIVYKCLDVISHHSIFDSCSLDTKLKILSKVFQRIQNYPQADTREVFLMKIYLRSMLKDDSSIDITKDEVVYRVIDVIKSYPKISPYKVTKETHVRNDLGLDDSDCELLRKALYLEFKLCIRPINEVKHTIDYIYDNRDERPAPGPDSDSDWDSDWDWDFEAFREQNRIGDVFWPVPLYS